MPLYAFRCDDCDYGDDISVPAEDRGNPIDCPECLGIKTMYKLFTAPYATAIGGIPNKFNLHWNEGDRSSRIHPTDGRRDERREYIRRARETKRKRRERTDE